MQLLKFTEVIKLLDGMCYNVDYHRERAARTVKHFYGKPFDLYPAIESISGFARNGLYKCRILYAAGIEEITCTPYTLRTIRSVGIVTDDTIDYAWKYADRSRLNYLLCSSGCDEVLIVKKGLVTDSSFSNLVFESDKGLFTPKECLLTGTKRRQLLEEGKITEATIPFEEISHYRKIHFINAMADLGEVVKYI